MSKAPDLRAMFLRLREMADGSAPKDEVAAARNAYDKALEKYLPRPAGPPGAWIIYHGPDGTPEWRRRPPVTAARVFGLPERASDATAHEYLDAMFAGRDTSEIKARAQREHNAALDREYWAQSNKQQKVSDEEFRAVWDSHPTKNLKGVAHELKLSVKQTADRAAILGLRPKRTYNKPT